MWRRFLEKKNPDEALDFLRYVAKPSKGWDEPNLR